MARITEYAKRRLSLRDKLWPDAMGVIYDRTRPETGFVTVPRTLPMVAALIRHLSPKRDPSRVYLELWARQRDDGFIEIDDADEFATIAGFHRGATRRVRSLREALEQLQASGFIRCASKGPRKYAYILILHPHDVVQRIRHETPNLIPDWWWDLFELRIREIGAELRWEPAAPSKPSVADEAFADFPG